MARNSGARWGNRWLDHVDVVGFLRFLAAYWVPVWLENSHSIEREDGQYPRHFVSSIGGRFSAR